MDKKCTICKTQKPLKDFPKHSGHVDGTKNQCKDCENERERNKRATNILETIKAF